MSRYMLLNVGEEILASDEVFCTDSQEWEPMLARDVGQGVGIDDNPIRRLVADDPQPSRYPWAEAPEWAMYAATDECGGAYWFESEPTAGVLACWTGGKFKRIMSIRPDWRESLERRPEKGETP